MFGRLLMKMLLLCVSLMTRCQSMDSLADCSNDCYKLAGRSEQSLCLHNCQQGNERLNDDPDSYEYNFNSADTSDDSNNNLRNHFLRDKLKSAFVRIGRSIQSTPPVTNKNSPHLQIEKSPPKQKRSTDWLQDDEEAATSRWNKRRSGFVRIGRNSGAIYTENDEDDEEIIPEDELVKRRSGFVRIGKKSTGKRRNGFVRIG
ncbi:hypothetical protein HELRODRAFT_180757 [Helobdella robusta]|uniref:Uncharacterized protein n=1 Tax=Helobdella robusta TaxID=6412 RepID=T1FG87_HELRO|nr:hypothetical protein HELRODRAFT_180757 [Helobdella robusta]ESN93663.1 hypothetical protein HELRODRAFT_180757 [Helobdella robusta]